MFRGCTAFNQPLEKWDVSKATEDLPQGVYIARFYGANSAKKSLRVMKH